MRRLFAKIVLCILLSPVITAVVVFAFGGFVGFLLSKYMLSILKLDCKFVDDYEIDVVIMAFSAFGLQIIYMILLIRYCPWLIV